MRKVDNTQPPATEDCLIKRIDHVEITTGDLDKTLVFYTGVLGFRVKERLQRDMPPLYEIDFLTLGDTMLEILAVKDPVPRSTHAWQVGYRMMALEVDDMDETIAELRKKRVEICREPVSIGKSRRAEIRDPNGLVIELRQW